MKLKHIREAEYAGKDWYVSYTTVGRAAEVIRNIGVARSRDKAIRLMAQDWNEHVTVNLSLEQIFNDFKNEAFDHEGQINVFPDDSEYLYVAKYDSYVTDEEI